MYIEKSFNCEARDVIYMISCTKEKCQLAYIGQTGKMLNKRIWEHKQYIKDENTNKAKGGYFCLSGHSLDNLQVTIKKKIKFYNEAYRNEREHYFIQIFNT